MIRAVLFDLDGVIVSTDEYHFHAWKKLADAAGIPFSREDNERLRGVSRMESLDIILERAARSYSVNEREELACTKNSLYREMLAGLTPRDILPGVTTLLRDLRSHGIKLAIGSSSRNAVAILQAIGAGEFFDIVVDGTQIQRSKPDPEVFLSAADRLGIPYGQCLVVEDALAGVEAAIAAGMPVLAIGSARADPRATLRASDLTEVSVESLLCLAQS
jgi:beta-phosphoglucomutase